MVLVLHLYFVKIDPEITVSRALIKAETVMKWECHKEASDGAIFGKQRGNYKPRFLPLHIYDLCSLQNTPHIT